MSFLHSLTEIASPLISEGNDRALGLESTLADLPLHYFQVEGDRLAQTIATVFEQHPALPGVIVLEQGQFLGMVSRQRFLEFLLHPQGIDLFLSRPLKVIYSYARHPALELVATTTILAAAPLALRRSSEHQGEPIVVQVGPETCGLLNSHELNKAYWQLRGIETQVRYERSQMQMIQTEKMASLGRLVDGIAHEILDPVGFIWGNLVHMGDYTDRLLELVSAYEEAVTPPPLHLNNLKASLELDYLRQDLPQTIASIKAGADRLKKLVISLQNFCHLDDVHPKPANLHECLDSIVLLLKSRLRGEIQIVQNYGHLPPVVCYAGHLNQVFMNILTNAVDALLNRAVGRELAEALGGRREAAVIEELAPQIVITTEVRSGSASTTATPFTTPRWVSVRITDNGNGLSIAQQQQILDSFSVEKRAAKETSLAMSYQIITAKHGGQFHFRSPILPNGMGTEFEILLPLG